MSGPADWGGEGVDDDLAGLLDITDPRRRRIVVDPNDNRWTTAAPSFSLPSDTDMEIERRERELKEAMKKEAEFLRKHCAQCRKDDINCTCTECECEFCERMDCSCGSAEVDEHGFDHDTDKILDKADADDEDDKLVAADTRASINLGSLFREAKQTGLITSTVAYN